MNDPTGLSDALGLPVFNIGLLRQLYRPLSSGEWELRIGGDAPCRGYWSSLVVVQDMVLLTRGKDTWMSLTPVEVESQVLGVGAASGHVAIMGLGMGWVAAETALRETVSRVTIIERDPDVIALHRELGLFPRLPGGAGDKIQIVEADALSWKPDEPVDLLMPDIWLSLVGGDRLTDVRRMQANVNAGQIYFWGQELEIARHAAVAGRALDAAGVVATLQGFELPIVYPDTDDYPGKIKSAAAQWMRNNWFDPGHVAVLGDRPTF